MIDGQANVTVEVLDKNGEPVTVLYPDHVFRLRITFPTLLATLFVFLASSFNSPIVKECMFSSSSEENLAYLINNGCGNIRFTNVFNPVEINEVESGRFLAETAEFKIPKIWLLQHDSVSIFCKVIICKKSLQYSQLCPLPIDIKAAKKGDILKIDGRTPNLTLKRIWLPPILPVVANMEKQTGTTEEKSWSYLPYLIIAIVLFVLLIVFTAILFCVIREQIKANKSKEPDTIKRLAAVDPTRPILWPVVKSNNKNYPIISKVGKSWFKRLQSQQIAGVGYPCLPPTNYLIQTNNSNQAYQLVSQPLQFVNQDPNLNPPVQTQHYFVNQPAQNSNFGSQPIVVNQPTNQPIQRSNSIQSNIGIQPYLSNTSIYPQQNPLSSQTGQFSVGNMIFHADARAQPLQTNDGTLPPNVNKPIQVSRHSPVTQPVQFVNTGFPQLASVSSPAGVQRRVMPQPVIMNPPQPVNPMHVNRPVPTYNISPLPRAQSYPTLSNGYGNNVIYEIWPPDMPRPVPLGFSDWVDDRHYYPPPWWPSYDDYPVDDPRYYDPNPRYYDPYLYRDVYDDRYRRRGDYPNCYNRPLARTTSLIDVMDSVLNNDRRRRPRRRYYSDFELNVQRPRERRYEYYEPDRPRYRLSRS
ncbi:hypothetical protein LOTGIDRAFT_166151 [Lottia gigantea]|uniref:ZP domain-containing protein n=1 Tax=Lottia gigantea TaxID=225164 RepID=V3ZZ11_LOTGI|nr:hypothetical protein LOTGIDRAFT_166151 [Lottia gigantea]ESO87850.1 hypothetical protein LOTGIDRAFT_166151 [Lottia gigantea]